MIAGMTMVDRPAADLRHTDLRARMAGVEQQYADAIFEMATAMIYPTPMPTDPASMFRAVCVEAKRKVSGLFSPR